MQMDGYLKDSGEEADVLPICLTVKHHAWCISFRSMCPVVLDLPTFCKRDSSMLSNICLQLIKWMMNSIIYNNKAMQQSTFSLKTIGVPLNAKVFAL